MEKIVKICPRCGTENDGQNLFCKFCRENLSETETSRVESNETLAETKRCVSCGELTSSEAAKYCGGCGERL